MAETGFEISVPITVKGGREGEKVGKQIGSKIAEQIQKAFRTIGIGKGEKGGDGTITGVAGVSKGLKGVATKLGIIAAVAGVAIGILRQASPYLKGILSIFGRAFMIFFRPFGDFLATLLRPLAILLMKMAIAFLKLTRTPLGKTAVAGAVGAGAGAAAGAAIGAVGGPIGAGAGAIIGGIIGLLSQVDWGSVGNAIKNFAEGVIGAVTNFIKDPAGFLTKVGEELKNVLGIAKTIISEVWTNFINWLGTALPQFAGWLGEKIGEGLRMIVDFILAFGRWLWEKLTTTFFTVLKILEGIGQWIWDTIVNFMKDPLGTLKNLGKWIWNTITGALSNISNKLSGIGSWIWNTITNSISSFLGGAKKGYKGYQVGTPLVPETGLYQLHRGEQVIPRGQTSKSVIFRPTFQITGSITKDIDMDAIVRRAGRMTEMELKKRGII